jgi:hypothetical protein
MPLIPFGSRYRPQGVPPPGLFAPAENIDPAFDPRALDAAPMPAPSQPPMAVMPPIQATLQSSGPRKVVMPPPGMDIAPPPPAPEAVQATVPKGMGAPQKMRAAELAPKPPTVADEQLAQAAQHLQQVQQAKPAAPKNNWAQRLALGTLALTKFAPVSDQIVHPIWSDRERQHKRDLEAATGEFGIAERAVNAEGLKEKREADAEAKYANIANADLARANTEFVNSEKTRLAEERIATQKLKANRDFLIDQIGDSEKQYQQETDMRPPGWRFLPDPDNPGYGFAASPLTVTATKELVPYLGGIPEGTQITNSMAKTARAAMNAAQAADNKPGTPAQEALEAWKRANPGKQPTVQDIVTIQRQLQPPSQTPNIAVSEDAITNAARSYHTTNKMPALGNGSKELRERIMNREAELYKDSDLAGAAAVYNADKNSLSALQKTADATLAFEKTARANLGQFLNAAQGIVDTGSPLLNKVFRGGARTVAGSDAQAQADAARVAAFTEIAKVLNNPNSNAALSDSARAESKALLDGDYTLPQLMRVADQLKRDMDNREIGLKTQIDDIKKRIAGGSGGAQQSPGGEKPPKAGEIVDGYRFKGGDAHDERNWEKVR